MLHIKILTNKIEYENARSKDLISLECQHCLKTFQVQKKYVKYALKTNKQINFCNQKCYYNHQKTGEEINCNYCNKLIYKRKHELNENKSGKLFCSSSCAASYNNTHKQYGHRRSKIEQYLETKLQQLYPDILFCFNQKDAINSELDIYIPNLKLAFELNGIYHYEPIYGQEKLNRIINNDQRKFQACLEKQIELCIIDISKLSYFKEKNVIPYLEIITNIINKKIGPREATCTPKG